MAWFLHGIASAIFSFGIAERASVYLDFVCCHIANQALFTHRLRPISQLLRLTCAARPWRHDLGNPTPH